MKVGSLVECIKDFSIFRQNRKFEKYETFPIKGNIYTVRGIPNDRVILLEEIINPIKPYNDGNKECAFDMEGFREIQPPMEINIEELMSEPLSV